MALRVVVTGDHPLFLQAVSATLREHPDVEVVATDTGVGDTLRLICETRPDVVVFDVGVKNWPWLVVRTVS